MLANSNNELVLNALNCLMEKNGQFFVSLDIPNGIVIAEIKRLRPKFIEVKNIHKFVLDSGWSKELKYNWPDQCCFKVHLKHSDLMSEINQREFILSEKGALEKYNGCMNKKDKPFKRTFLQKIRYALMWL